jgi:hypothetical protein
MMPIDPPPIEPKASDQWARAILVLAIGASVGLVSWSFASAQSTFSGVARSIDGDSLTFGN